MNSCGTKMAYYLYEYWELFYGRLVSMCFKLVLSLFFVAVTIILFPILGLHQGHEINLKNFYFCVQK